MKLLVVSQYFWPENFRINDICDGLIARGHRVDVLTSLPNVPQGKFYEGYGWFRRGPKEHNGVGIERVGVVQRGQDNALRLMLNCATFALNSLFHIPKLKKNDYDAVFVFNNSPVSKILPAKVMARKKRIPNIIFILDIWPESMYFLLGMKEGGPDTLFRKISRAVSKWLYKSGDLLLISSAGFEPKLRDMGIEGDIRFFPNYAEPLAVAQHNPPTREELGFKETNFVVGFAGNIGKAQRLDKLVAAACKTGRADTRYLIVGDGPERRAVEKAVADSKRSDQFVFTGWVDSAKVPGYLALCDALLVSLEDHEVLNLVVPAKLQTYMYAAKPIIAFMNGAGAKVVQQADCGVTATAGDVDALCRAIDALAQTPPERRAEMGENGQIYCQKHYDRQTILDSLVGHIEAAIKDYRK
jgi:glycosyltransferase involved in cell wall biosynthesis